MSVHEQSHEPNDNVHNHNSDPNLKRPFSIDLSLELERQLDLESQPSTPADSQFPNPHPHPHSAPPNKRESLDPHVLASIIMQLRQSLTEMTKERDDLLALVSTAHTQEAELKDALQHMNEKCTTMEEELQEARRKMKDDEDAIAMLRTKVEESRRGLMRLQTESRRQSTAPMGIDLSRAGIPSFGGSGPTPLSAKRASFTPLTGAPGSFAARPNGHRRISSVSDSGGFGYGGGAGLMVPDLSTSPSPYTQTFGFNDNDSTTPTNQTPASSRRLSGIVGRGSPPRLDNLHPFSDNLVMEVEAMRRELRTLKDELDETRHELSESNEAREASETCVKALREFIAENNVGETTQAQGVKLPATISGEEDGSAQRAGGGGWGFKLWKVDTTVKASSGTAGTSPANAHAPQASIPTPAPTPTLAQVAPLSRKIGGFFSSRASISSTTSSFAPQLQTNAHLTSPHLRQRDSLYTASDTSSMVESLAEPISPTSGDGDINIIVKDITNGRNSPGPEDVQVKGLPHHMGMPVLTRS